MPINQLDYNIKLSISDEKLNDLLSQAEQEGIKKIVCGAVIVKDHKILIIKRSLYEEFKAGLEELPSGEIDQDKTLIQGLIREVYEETGLKIKTVKNYLGSFDYISKSGKKARQFNFLVEVQEGKIVLNPREHCEHKWVSTNSEKHENINVSDNIQIVIEEVIKLLTL